MKRNRKKINVKEQSKKLYKHRKDSPVWERLRDLIEEDSRDYEMLDNERVISTDALMADYRERHAADPDFKLGRYHDVWDEMDNFRLFVIQKHNSNTGMARKVAGIESRVIYETKWKPADELPAVSPMTAVAKGAADILYETPVGLPEKILDMRVKDLKKMFPEQRFSSFNTVREVFSPSRSSGKLIQATREFILSNQERILNPCAVHAAACAVVESLTIPAEVSANMNLGLMLRAFTREYAETRKKALHRKIFEESYVWTGSNPDPMPQADLASVVGRTGERVRQVKMSMAEECRRLLVGREEVNHVRASSDLCDKIAELTERIGNTVSFDTFRRVSEVIDGKTTVFLADILAYNISEDKNVRVRCVSKYQVKQFDREVSSVLHFFRKEVLGLRMDMEVRGFLNKKYSKHPDILDMLLSFIANSDEFERIKDADGHENVTLRWDLLQNIDSELCRILHDKSAFDIKHAIYADDLVRIYNREYAKPYGVKLLSSADQLPSMASRGCWRPMTLSRTGYWMLRRSRNEKFKDLASFAKECVLRDRNDADGFFAAAKEIGYDRIYSRQTFNQSFVAAGGRVVRREKVVRGEKAVKKVVRRKVSEKSAIMDYAVKCLNEVGTAMRVSELYEMVSRRYDDLHNATFAQWLKTDGSRRFSLNLGSGKRSSVIAPVGVEPEMILNFRDAIREAAAKELLSAPDNRIPYKDMQLHYASMVPREQKSVAAALSKTFGDKEFFTKTVEKDGTVMLSLTRKAIVNMRAKFGTSLAVMPARATTKLGYEWESLRDTLIKELTIPYREVPRDEMVRSLDTMLEIMKYGVEDFEGSSPFSDVLKMLPAHYDKMLEKDREDALKKNCLGCIELFLKNFYRMKYGYDISSAVYSGTIAGMSTYCAILDGKGVLPYKGFFEKGTIEIEIKHIVSDLISARNRQVGHQGRVTDKSALTIEQNIHHTLALFVWLSSKLHA